MAGHVWVRTTEGETTFARCTRCMAGYRVNRQLTKKGLPGPAELPCKGRSERVVALQEIAHAQGHTLWQGLLVRQGEAQGDEALPLLACAACGSWAMAAHRKGDGLAKPCRQVPTRVGGEVLSRLG